MKLDASGIELFVCDVLDARLKDAREHLRDPPSVAGWLPRMLSSPMLRDNLAFHAAWKAALAGARPSRMDYWAFKRRQRSGGCGSAPDALVATLLDRAPAVRMVPNAQETMQHAVKAYVGFDLGHADPAHLTRLVISKLADRLGIDVAVQEAPEVRGKGLVQAYTWMCQNSRDLGDFEEWAGLAAAHRAPSCLKDLHERTADVLRSLDLVHTDPLTGAVRRYTDDDDAEDGEDAEDVALLTAREALWASIQADGHLWRTERGGTLILVMAEAKCDLPCRSDTNRRQRVLACTSPAQMRVIADQARALYSTIAVMDSASATLTVRGPGEQKLSVRLDSAHLTHALISDGHGLWAPSASECVWATALRSEVVRSALTSPMRHPGQLLVQQFMVLYAHARGLLHGAGAGRRFERALPPTNDRLGDVVLIDTRENPWSVLSALMALDNLRDGAWGLRVFCSSRSRAFYERALRPRVPHADIQSAALGEHDDGGKFDMESYNALLKSSPFWRSLVGSGCRRVLLVQDDGVLSRPGMDREGSPFMAVTCAYVGAPWMEHPSNGELQRLVPGMVGNGGLSLRRPDAMLRMCEQQERLSRSLFNGGLQPIPEDVFFASALGREGLTCDARLAEGFAFEERAPLTDTVLGFHKPWPYVSVEAVRDTLASMLRDARDRAV
jgi:hypothetical protein